MTSRDLVPANASRALARLGASARADSIDSIDSLDKIRPPYPPLFSAEWWALRKRLLALIGVRQSRLRGDEPMPAELVKLSPIALDAALGDEQASRQYEALDPETGLHVHLSPALLALRERDPARFAAISAEAKRLQALGKPRAISLAGATRAMPQ